MTSYDRALSVLAEVGAARSRDFERAGISRTQICRLLEDGLIERIARGLYRRTGSEYSEGETLVEVARRIPNGIICLLSALRFHGLTMQNPIEVWIAIDHKAWRPRMDYPPPSTDPYVRSRVCGGS